MSNPYIFWQRLEPRPRRNSLRPGLASPVRDPLWMVSRQWQVGEFIGENAGTPTTLKYRLKERFPLEMTVGGSDLGEPESATALESRLSAEPAPATTRTRVALAEALVAMLQRDPGTSGRAEGLVEQLNALAPLSVSDDDELGALLAGRLFDGIKIYEIVSEGGEPSLAGYLEEAGAVFASTGSPLETLLTRWAAWVTSTYGAVSGVGTYPRGWSPQDLDFQGQTYVTTPGEEAPTSGATLELTPDRGGGLSWYGAAITASSSSHASDTSSAPSGKLASGVMSRLVLPQAPPRRWWRFERARDVLVDIKPDLHDLGMLLVVDFLHRQADDWFIVPVEVAHGALVGVEEVEVLDTFSDIFQPSASALARSEDWRAFGTSGVEDGVGAFWVGLGAGVAHQSSEPLEELRLLRDDLANLGWAIEERLCMPSGEIVRGVERHQALHHPEALPQTDAELQADPVLPVYTLQRPTLDHWFPLVPVPAKGDAPPPGELALGALMGGSPKPSGRILSDYVGQSAARLSEHALPRPGVRVLRRWLRSRGPAGQIHLRLSREVRLDAGDERGALRFDLLTEESS